VSAALILPSLLVRLAHMADPCGNAPRTLGEQPAKLRARGALISPRDCEIFSPGKISMKLFWTATFCALLGGCASSTGILPAGPDTYTISEKYAPIRGGGVEAQRESLTKASEFCVQQGLQFVPSVMGPSGTQRSYGPTGYAVTFKCLPPSDAAAKTYQVQQMRNLMGQQQAVR
jgi:hypothetical protein